MMHSFVFAPFGFVFMILFWGFVFILLLSLIKNLTKNTSEKDDSSSSLEILKIRYAKGEIDKKEFEAKKKDLLR